MQSCLNRRFATGSSFFRLGVLEGDSPTPPSCDVAPLDELSLPLDIACSHHSRSHDFSPGSARVEKVDGLQQRRRPASHLFGRRRKLLGGRRILLSNLSQLSHRGIDLAAELSVTFALSEFWAMEEVICSRDALACSTPAACSLAARERDWAVELTWASARKARTTPRQWVFALGDERCLIHPGLSALAWHSGNP